MNPLTVNSAIAVDHALRSGEELLIASTRRAARARRATRATHAARSARVALERAGL